MRNIFVLVIIIGSLKSHAQWNGTDPNSSTWRNGNVGIGINSPSSKLEIRGTTDNNFLFIRQDKNSGGSGDVFFLRDDRGYGGNNLGTTFKIESWRGYGQQGGTLANFTTIDNGYYKSRFYINNDNGFIGLGTSTPKVPLQVDGTSGLQSRLRVVSPYIGCSVSYDMTMGTADDNLGAGLRAYVPTGQPGYDRIYLGLYTTTYSGGLQSRVERLTITDAGNVGIGTAAPGNFKLAVEGKVGASEVVVTLARPWPDYVFEKNYNLRTLAEVEDYINQNKHLPEVPAAKELEANGVNLGEMNMLLLKKVEELTLYMIELKKENEKQQEKIESLEEKQLKYEK